MSPGRASSASCSASMTALSVVKIRRWPLRFSPDASASASMPSIGGSPAV